MIFEVEVVGLPGFARRPAVGERRRFDAWQRGETFDGALPERLRIASSRIAADPRARRPAVSMRLGVDADVYPAETLEARQHQRGRHDERRREREFGRDERAARTAAPPARPSSNGRPRAGRDSTSARELWSAGRNRR